MNLTDKLPELFVPVVRYIRWDASEAAPKVIFPQSILKKHDLVTTYIDALEVIFRELNVVDGTEYISTAQLRIPSMSVGDTVQFLTRDGARYFVCEGAGWKEITEFDANWLVDYVTHRDFWGTFDKTVEKSNEFKA